MEPMGILKGIVVQTLAFHLCRRSSYSAPALFRQYLEAHTLLLF